MITQAIDESRLVTLAGNTRPEASTRNDRGSVSAELHLDMYLQMKRSPEAEIAASRFVESLTDKSSPNFHKWITAAEYGRRFGVAPDDIARVSVWLKSHGFSVNGVTANNMVIDFSGTAEQVREALHTEIHNLEVDGKRYFANMSDPQIPAALLPAVAGIVSLSNIMPSPMLVPRADFTANPRTLPLVPGDIATIYNLNPAFAAGYIGTGQTIVVVEDTDVYNKTGDWSAFRQTFGLSRYSNGSLTQVHPSGGLAGSCLDPGINSDAIEAALDVEWASAAAPDAAIVMASCANTTNFGGFIALLNMLSNGGPLPGVVSISYGEPETAAGAAQNSFINVLYQTAAALGVSVFVSSGDSSAASADRGAAAAVQGVSVSAFASTAYNVAVGGTDFGDYAAGSTFDFWNPSNGIYFDSAQSYVPEIPWNDSCGSRIAAAYYGFASSYGTSAFCNAYPYLAATTGGSGGPSGCATGVQTVVYAVSGTCAGYRKPSWQSIFGNPNDGVRDLPDVALFASNGFWSHYYVICFSGESACGSDPSKWAGVGGTSASSPIMAGIQALINQALGATNAGNPNPMYYEIAQSEYGTPAGRSTCNSTVGPATNCAFNDVTAGDIVVPCAGGLDCYTNGVGFGLLSTSDRTFQPAYAAGPGWDFATGIGSVNAFNLLNAFVDSVSSFAAPAAPVLVSPASGATGVSPAPSLTWAPSAGATSYDVYFGTSSTPPLVSNTTSLNYSPGAVSPATTYYWAVGARNSMGANASTAWSFTTDCVSALTPSSATAPASGVSGTIPVTAPANCSWTATSNVSWMTITAGASGTGNGSVAYTVAGSVAVERTGTITVADQTFTITQAGIFPLISTLAGGAMPPVPVPATSVSIPVSYGVAVDSSGNTYFASPMLNAVFKADPTGVVTQVAGTGVPGHSGDGGPALNAQLNSPTGVAVDSLGNIYIADTNNYRIAKVNASGSITTLAGTGRDGYTGDGGPANIAQIGFSYGVAVDPSGNVYFSDSGNAVVRKVTADGIITTVAGKGSPGYSGDGAAAAAAQLNGPYGVAVDGNGNLYIADARNSRVRMVSSAGVITTVAGNGSCCSGGDGGSATSAQLCTPVGVASDATGDLYIADSCTARIRKVASGGIISTAVGTGLSGYSGDGGNAAKAQIATPEGVAVDASGNLYIADSGNVRIRKVDGTDTITTYVGGGINDGGLAVFGLLNQPSGVARDKSGNTFVSDTVNNRVRKIAANGIISTVAGIGAAGFGGDGSSATSASLNSPQGLALDASGNLYIADSNNHRVRMVDGSGNITTIAGNGACCVANGDGSAATAAQIGTPWGITFDQAGSLYISDISNHIIRKVASGNISTVAGTGTFGYSGDGGTAITAKLNSPHGLGADSTGNLYIADTANRRVRVVSSSGTITTIAGSGLCCYSGDGAPAISAELCNPVGITLDAGANLYISDSCNETVRIVASGGTITTVAGNGVAGYSGDGELAFGSTLRGPSGIAADPAGNIAIADQGNNVVRLLTPAETAPVLRIQSQHNGSFTKGQAGATYTVTVSNGSRAGASSGPVTVTENLPSAVSLVSMGGSGWTCSVAPSPTCTRADTLSGGISWPAITVTVNVSATPPSQWTNQVIVSGGGGNIALAEDLTIVTSPGSPAPPTRRGR